MMAHEDYHSMMSAMLDGEIAPGERADLLRHMETCAPCQTTWDRLAQLDGLFAHPEFVPPPPDFSVQVMARLEADKAAQRRWALTVVLALLAVVAIMGLAPTLGGAVGLMVVLRRVVTDGGALGTLITLQDVGLATLTAFGHGLRAWLRLVASQPGVQAMAIAALVLASTWIGLLEVFGRGQKVSVG
jgi:predicted anti-sigma-YlaC factor YlaD